MLQILNQRERNEAFFKFVVFFLLTITLIVAALYVDFRGLPDSRRSTLEQSIEMHRSEKQAQYQFVHQMEKAKEILDSLGKNPDTYLQLEMKLIGQLSELDRLRQTDSSLYGKLNATIMSSFLELQRLKKDRMTLKEIASRVSELEVDLVKCQSSLDNHRNRQQPIAMVY